MRSARILRALVAVALCVAAAHADRPARPAPASGRLAAEVALAFWQGGWQHIVIQPVFADDSASRPGPDAWLFPVQSPPSVAEAADDSLLDSVWRWIDRVAVPVDDVNGAVPRDVDPVPAARADAWEVTVLSGVASVREWCASSGVAPPPDSSLEHYVGFSFVTARPRTGVHAPGPGGFPALSVAFPTDKLVLPLRAQSGVGPFHVVLLTATSRPVNLRDARAHGLVPMDEEARRRQDVLLRQTGVSDTARSIVWHDLAKLYTTRRRADSSIARSEWLNERMRGWESAPVSRLTRFAMPEGEAGELGTFFARQRIENRGDAPPIVVREYAEFARLAGLQVLDSLYVSALAGPWMGLAGSETDLSRWSRDPAIRLRDLLTPLPPYTPPYPPEFVADTAWSSPAPELLPATDALAALFESCLGAESSARIAEIARSVVRQDQASPRVVHLRQILVQNRLAEVRAVQADGDSLLLPDADLPAQHPRSIPSLERSLRPVKSVLQAMWVAAQYSPQRPNPLIVVPRLRITPDGSVTLVSVSGNAPSGMAVQLLRAALERGVECVPAEAEFVLDVPIIVEE